MILFFLLVYYASSVYFAYIVFGTFLNGIITGVELLADSN